MAGFARIVDPGCPYHVTYRGNRREAVFFAEEERRVFVDLLGEYARKYRLRTWGYCLMTNHLHLLVVGDNVNSLADALGRCAMRYSRWVNRWHGWSGHLWGDRFHSSSLDEAHVWTAIRYIGSCLLVIRSAVTDLEEGKSLFMALPGCPEPSGVIQ